MGREIRMVPKTWRHPVDTDGKYIPMHTTFPYNNEEIEEGLREGWLHGLPPFYDINVMPQFDSSEATHMMMYETCSEGTPISPAFFTAEELARWLVDNEASAFGPMTATYEEWLRICKPGGSAVSMVIQNGVMKPGVAL